MFNEDVLDLYPRIPVGTVVTVTWERFKTGPAMASEREAAPAPAKRRVVNNGRKGEAPTRTVAVE
jgi:hypothetical protein